jgi:anti-sigma regulatory factor (Ser/Thr protein kinase)
VILYSLAHAQPDARGVYMERRGMKKEIQFLDSYNADTSTVPTVIEKLISDLREMGYPQAEVDEIIISLDEAITNAVQETIRHKEHSAERDKPLSEITVRYKITENEFDATIIDKGGGLDILKSLSIIPDASSDRYFNEVLDYSGSIGQEKLKISINGKEIPLHGIGAGLRILLSFMDSISIDLIDKEKIVSDCVSDTTDGTILTVRRKRRY